MRLRQEDHEFKVSLGYIASLKNNKNPQNKKRWGDTRCMRLMLM
jgi:hypothetical protein